MRASSIVRMFVLALALLAPLASAALAQEEQQAMAPPGSVPSAQQMSGAPYGGPDMVFTGGGS